MDYLVQRSRAHLFSNALPPSVACGSLEALRVLRREPDRLRKLRDNTRIFREKIDACGFHTIRGVTPIVPVLTHNDETALEMTRICRADGLLVIPVCYPAVPMNAPRLRTCVSAIHTSEDIDFALEVLARAGRQTGLIQ